MKAGGFSQNNYNDEGELLNYDAERLVTHNIQYAGSQSTTIVLPVLLYLVRLKL